MFQTPTKYYYCVNTVDKGDNPVQLDGYIEAESEERAIKNLIDAGIICPRSYEFLELVQSTDWLVRGISETQLQKEKEDALKGFCNEEYSIQVSMTPHPWDCAHAPYFWVIFCNGCNSGCGWSQTPADAWKDASKYFSRHIGRRSRNESKNNSGTQ